MPAGSHHVLMGASPAAPAGDAEFRELADDGLSVLPWTNRFVDVQNPAVQADVERPADGWSRVVLDHAVRPPDLARSIAEQRIIDRQRLGKSPEFVRRIDARREMLDVERANRIAALPERLALRRSTTAECSRKPCEHDYLFAAVICEAIRAPVRPLEGKRGSDIADARGTRRTSRLRGLRGYSGRQCGHQRSDHDERQTFHSCLSSAIGR